MNKYKANDKVIFSYNGYENEVGTIIRVIKTMLEDNPYWYDVKSKYGIFCLREEYIEKKL